MEDKDIRTLLNEITTNHQTIYANVCVIREVFDETNTCTVEPVNNVDFEENTPNIDNFIYDIKYSPKFDESTSMPSLGAYVFVIFDSPTSGFIVLSSSNDEIVIGGNGSSKIVMKTKEGELGVNADDGNENSVMFILSDTFRIDLSYDRGLFEYTGKIFAVSDIDQFLFQTKCGNSIEIKCPDGIFNTLAPNGKFFLGKTTSTTSVDCDVIKPISTNAPDIKNMSLAIAQILRLQNGLKIKDDVFTEIEELNDFAGKTQLLSMIDKITNTNIREVYTDTWNIMTTEYLSNYEYNNENFYKYYHSDYKIWADGLIDVVKKTPKSGSKFFKTVDVKYRILNYINKNPENRRYVSITNFKSKIDPLMTYKTPTIAITTAVGFISDLIYDGYNYVYVDYAQHKLNCEQIKATTSVENATITLKTILDDFKDTINSLVNDIKKLSTTNCVSGSPLIGAPTFQASATLRINELTAISADIDNLLL